MSDRSPTTRAPAHRRIWLIGGLVTALLVIVSAMPAAAASGRLPGHFGGHADTASASAHAGPLATKLGRAAYTPCPCLGTDGSPNENRVTGVHAGKVATLGVTTGKAWARKSNSRTAESWTKSRVSDVDLFEGLITADLILGVARTKADPRRIRVWDAGSKLVNLKVADTVVTASVQPNTRLDLPGLGHVVLRKHDRFGSGSGRRGIRVTMVFVRITVPDNDYDLPVGTEIWLGRARALFDRSPIQVELAGSAFATAAANTVGDVKNRVGRAAVLYVGCEGTDGKKKKNHVDDFAAGDFVGIGTGHNTAKGATSGPRGVVTMTSKVEDAWVFDVALASLGNIVEVDLLKAVAHASFDTRGNKGVASSEGSRIANIKVAGVLDIPIVVPPNTRIEIPGVGRIVLYERVRKVTRSSAFVKVTMVRVVLEESLEGLGLPVGTSIKLASARAKASR